MTHRPCVTALEPRSCAGFSVSRRLVAASVGASTLHGSAAGRRPTSSCTTPPAAMMEALGTCCPPMDRRGSARRYSVVAAGEGRPAGGARSAFAVMDPGCRVGMRPVKNSASAATPAMMASAARSALSRAFAFSSTIADWVLPVTMSLVELRLEVVVRQERNPAGQLRVRLLRDARRDVRVLLDPRQQRRGEAGDQHRPCQRGPERRPEVRRRVLQAAHFGALRVGDR